MSEEHIRQLTAERDSWRRVCERLEQEKVDAFAERDEAREEAMRYRIERHIAARGAGGLTREKRALEAERNAAVRGRDALQVQLNEALAVLDRAHAAEKSSRSRAVDAERALARANRVVEAAVAWVEFWHARDETLMIRGPRSAALIAAVDAYTAPADPPAPSMSWTEARTVAMDALVEMEEREADTPEEDPTATIVCRATCWACKSAKDDSQHPTEPHCWMGIEEFDEAKQAGQIPTDATWASLSTTHPCNCWCVTPRSTAMGVSYHRVEHTVRTIRYEVKSPVDMKDLGQMCALVRREFHRLNGREVEYDNDFWLESDDEHIAFVFVVEDRTETDTPEKG